MRNPDFGRRGLFALLATAAALLPATVAHAQQRLLFVSDEFSNVLYRFNGATGAPAGGNYPAPLAGAEGISVHDGRWVLGTAHKSGANGLGLYVYDMNNGANSRNLFTTTSTGLAGTAFDYVNRILYTTDENTNLIARYRIDGLGGGNINGISATLLNSVTLSAAHDVTFHNGELYVTGGAGSFKGVKKYSADLSVSTDFISSAAAIAAGYGGTARTTGMVFSPDGGTFFLASADFGNTTARIANNFIGRFDSSGNFLNKINNPTSGNNVSQLRAVLGMTFEQGDLYVAPYLSTDAIWGAKVTRLDFSGSGDNYATGTPTLSAFVGNAGGPQGAKYLAFATAVVPEPGEWATMGLAALSVGGLMLRARKKR